MFKYKTAMHLGGKKKGQKEKNISLWLNTLMGWYGVFNYTGFLKIKVRNNIYIF